MHFAGTLGVMRRAIITVTGNLSGSASTNTVTGGAGTVNVPAGGSGVITIGAEDIGAGVGNLEHNKAGAGFVTTGGTITFANGDSIVFRATGVASGSGVLVTLSDGIIPVTSLSLVRT